MEPFLAILNPAAGGGRGRQVAQPILAALKAQGVAYDVSETAEPGDATRIARDAWANGRRRFLAMGGDGTSFEILNGLFPEALDGDSPPEIAIVPLGTGNSFLRDFTTRGAQATLEALQNETVRPVDVVRLEHTDGVLFFINLMSLGFVADVGAVTNRRFKRFGEAGYVLGVLTTLARLKPALLPFRADEGPQEEPSLTFLAVCNSRYTGGKMCMAPEAETADGEADLILVHPMGRLGLLGTFPKIFKGTHLSHPATEARRVRVMDFALTGPTDVMIDGEVLTLQPTRLEVLPGAMKLWIQE